MHMTRPSAKTLDVLLAKGQIFCRERYDASEHATCPFNSNKSAAHNKSNPFHGPNSTEFKSASTEVDVERSLEPRPITAYNDMEHFY